MLKAAAISSLYRYKDLIIADRIKAIEEALKATEKASDDITDIFALLEKQKTLNEIRVQINKILGIVIAK